jgi:hypothetical protein
VVPYVEPQDPWPVIRVVWVACDALRSDKLLLVGQGGNNYTYSCKNTFAHIFADREMTPPDIQAGWYLIKYIRKGETLCQTELFYFAPNMQ